MSSDKGTSYKVGANMRVLAAVAEVQGVVFAVVYGFISGLVTMVQILA